VFFNLLGNALKFTPRGGTIGIEARLLDRAVDVRVTDSGIGIDPEFLPHVFERFRQADSTSTRTYGGLGLGLSIAKQLVEAHKGSIAVESAGAGHGATFIVQLPLASSQVSRRPSAAAPPRRSLEDVPRLDGTRVLIVDDEPAAREVMAYALMERGARVTAAATATDAFTLLAAEPFDVLLADIAMPGEDGCSLMRRVRASTDDRVAGIPAAAVTAHARDDERRDVLAAGFHAHLVKPIEPGELARAVGALTRRGSGLEAVAT
jgi:CheY-like chemotaxis protein